MITLYSKPNCMQCKFTKEYLLNHDIKFKNIDVSVDKNALTHITDDLGYMTLPVIELDTGESWFGFRPDLLEALNGE